MPRPYSNDLRERVAAAVTDGRTRRETAALFGGSVASVVKWSERQWSCGTALARRIGRQSGRDVERHRAWLLVRVASQPL